jgi:mannose-1-phosphate guanylyltransferase/mannose-6-phosphate isomerase
LIIPVILCGGAGSRLWPVSRRDSPKPFLPLVDGVSTFALTLARTADPAVFGPAVVIASVAHRHLVKAALAAAGTDATVLLEPEPRDTAPAIAAAAAFVGGADPGATLLILAADHVIKDVAAFAATVDRARPAADSGRIVPFGVVPDRPATSYGYIAPGGAIDGTEARAIAAFVEKPDHDRASELIDDGCLWNAGIFMAGATAILAEIGVFAPEIEAAAVAAVKQNGVGEDGCLSLGDSFSAAPKISFDHAVMEKTDRAAVVAAGFDWSDIGTWSAVWDAASRDEAGNARSGDAVIVDSRGTYVATTRPRVGVVGVDNIVVVASDDAVLVTSRARADQVKNLVAELEAGPEKVLGDYVRHYRPWGYYQTLDLGEHHQVKRLVVNPGARLSLQKHAHRSETWTVVKGVAEVTIDGEVIRLEENRSAFIPLGAIHRIVNPGDVPVTLIEVQYGSYLGEDDIVRIEDDYGRRDA